MPNISPQLLLQGIFYLFYYFLAEQDHEVSLDQANKLKIKLSPIPQDTTGNPIKFTFPDKPDIKSEKLKERPDENIPIPTHYDELNYDDILSKTINNPNTGPHLEQALSELINQDDDNENEEHKLESSEEKGSHRLSSSRAQNEEDNPINPIKDFNTKTSRIFADSESSKLNSSVVSQRGIDPFLITNSSVMSTYLYKAPNQKSDGSNANNVSNIGSQLPSPSKTNSSNALRGFKQTLELTVFF